MENSQDQLVKLEQEQGQKQSRGQRKRPRRTKNDQQGRNFQCPCGKSYLSYPALYTHVKTKHQGKDKFLSQKVLKDFGTAVQKQQKNLKLKDTPLKVIKSLLNKHLNAQMQPFFTQKITPQINQYFQQISIHRTLNKPQNPATQKINNIFYRFFTKLNSDISLQCKSYLKHFLYNIRNLINQTKEDENYCQTKAGFQLPQFFNKLILQKKVPIQDRWPQIPNYWLILAVKLLFQFGEWLREQGYTNYKTSYNYPIDRPNSTQ